jgi:hypothetical protein
MQIVAGRGYRGRVWLAKGPRPRPAKRGDEEIGVWLCYGRHSGHRDNNCLSTRPLPPGGISRCAWPRQCLVTSALARILVINVLGPQNGKIQ